MRQTVSKSVRGITLVELMFAVAIVAVLCSISLPALGGLMRSEQSRSAHNALVAALNLARSTAATQQAEIVVCPSSDATHCDNSVWWQHGWIVFRDADRNGKRDTNESLIQVGQAQSGMAIASSAGRKHVDFRADGSAPGSNLTFTFCDSRGVKRADTVVVSNPGRVRSGRASAAQAAAACAGLQAP
jgi:type IV fimbrial biogenesis protein FimT